MTLTPKEKQKKHKKKLYCPVCSFTLTRCAKGYEKVEGDICPWCRRGRLIYQKEKTKKRYYEITSSGDKQSSYILEKDSGYFFESWLKGMPVGYGLKVEVVEMTEEEVKNSN